MVQKGPGWAVRSEVVDLRTYRRPLDESGTAFETQEMMLDRSVLQQQRRLREEAGVAPNEAELSRLLSYCEANLVSVAGRTRWLGGTPTAWEKPECQYNCSFLELATVYDAVDLFHLELVGCGTGFRPVPGTLTGFARRIEKTEIIHSHTPPDGKGRKTNIETWDSATKTWTIGIGDSEEAWARALGKLLLHRYPARKLIIDVSEVRQGGKRLKGFGWICNGPEPLVTALLRIVDILNRKTASLLDAIDIIDTINHLGTVLSTRRSAQIALVYSNSNDIYRFRSMKHNCWPDNTQRFQSNNTVLQLDRPSRSRLIAHLLDMDEYGGGDPAICNVHAAMRRAPWFAGFNPCAEILLASHGFCNLVEANLDAFSPGDITTLTDAIYLIARANYAQTCVDLMKSGILQPRWHQTNEALRLCGGGVTGCYSAQWLTDYDIRTLRHAAISGAHSMADELGLPRAKAVTTIKPSGTLSKVMMSNSEGVHAPLGRFIFNKIGFNQHDPLVPILEAAGYAPQPHPNDTQAVIIAFPVEHAGRFTNLGDGFHANTESAISQLERYRRWNRVWADHNVSCTVSYYPDELDAIADWLDAHWDSGDFVSVSFMKRQRPDVDNLRAAGQLYLPQTIVDERTFREYEQSLDTPDFSKIQHTGIYDLVDVADCAAGGCPVR